MAKTRHYRKRTTRRHNKRTRKHKRGGSSPPRKIKGSPFDKEYKVNAHGENSAPKGSREPTKIKGSPFAKEYKPYGV